MESDLCPAPVHRFLRRVGVPVLLLGQLLLLLAREDSRVGLVGLVGLAGAVGGAVLGVGLEVAFELLLLLLLLLEVVGSWLELRVLRCGGGAV